MVAAAAGGALVWAALLPRTSGSSVDHTAAEREPIYQDDLEVTVSERLDLLRRAHVWRAPAVPIGKASLSGQRNLAVASCRFRIDDVGGTTPKFDCELDNGDSVRIKYGRGPEALTEAAATRLLRALGFGADEVTLVEKLRCYGCPIEPFAVLKAAEVSGTEPLLDRIVDPTEFRELEWVAMETKFEARPIETELLEGWSFFELDMIDPAAGGAPRAHVDALRIVAVLLAHWDNKPDNQRMVCLAREWPEDESCPEPFLLLQDVGATFGPLKLDFDQWAETPIWENRAACTLSMRTLPFDGATFGIATVTEEGRRFAGRLLSQLSEEQLTGLFAGARFDRKRGLFRDPTPVSEWVRAFKVKVRDITTGPPCP